ncbi:MAG TPA: hypothetical protein VMJ10_28880 [Kofleriaceae bacterium]|nr:hypothetical protein [Kofleriaceae bacterium]
MSAKDDDWRLRGQEKYLHGASWTWKTYRRYRDNWEHDHCSFCWAKLTEPGTDGEAHEGYSTKNDYYWVCATCFDDFKERFAWTKTI